MPLKSFICLIAVLALSGCTMLSPSDPLRIDLVGLEPLPAQGMEMRFAVVLRVQNPNDSVIDYNGLSVELDVNHQPLASGVSDASGQVPRFGEALLKIPVTISAFSVMRQAWAAAGYQQGRNLPYELRGKLGGGLFGTARFNSAGTLNWPQTANTP
ncbi:LEA type 2 family protein [Pseudomonas sp. BMS12]|uniref:LEA type 2 family protein n=1 Tax=Pseudomonas sp. BMS12 TaxID=1796033 RepID=UPI00083B5F03|nr:LEA type 2 family protein [Pseudomonas sp. BMS12]